MKNTLSINIVLMNLLVTSHSYGMNLGTSAEYTINRAAYNQAESALTVVPHDLINKLFFTENQDAQTSLRSMLMLRTTCALWFKILNTATRRNIAQPYFNPNEKLATALLGSSALSSLNKQRITTIKSFISPEWFIFAGADIHSANAGGQSFMGLAASLHDSHCLAMLIAHGGLVNSPDKEGNAPLHYAVKKNALTCIHLLLQHNASKDIRNKAGKTPKDCILSSSLPVHNHMTRLLENNITVQDTIANPIDYSGSK